MQINAAFVFKRILYNQQKACLFQFNAWCTYKLDKKLNQLYIFGCLFCLFL